MRPSVRPLEQVGCGPVTVNLSGQAPRGARRAMGGAGRREQLHVRPASTASTASFIQAPQVLPEAWRLTAAVPIGPRGCIDIPKVRGCDHAPRAVVARVQHDGAGDDNQRAAA